MITRSRDKVIDMAFVNDCILQFDLGQTRLSELYNYCSGVHAIAVRPRTSGLPNNKLTHAYPQYIVVMTSGYLVGDPVQYMDEKQKEALKAVMEAYETADVQSVDAEVALNQAIFGRGTEVVYANQMSEPKVASIDPQNAFVVYDDTVEALPLLGVYRVKTFDSQGALQTRRITAYTDSEIIEYSVLETGFANEEVSRTPHYFGIVPLIEYWNNSAQTSDFEFVKSLIDAYDVLESDRINDKEQFAKALLVLTGVVGFKPAEETEEETVRSPAQQLREEGTLTLPDIGAKAEYLTKVLEEADTDVLRQALKKDIHKFSNVPDLTDENFAGNSSGVAMKYKLFGLEQLTKIKERWFREGLRWRLRIFANYLSVKGFTKLDADKVQMVFKRSLPVNDKEIAEVVQTLKDVVPDTLLLAQVPFVEDVEAAVEMLAEQRKEGAKLQAEMFGKFPNANEDDQDASDDDDE